MIKFLYPFFVFISFVVPRNKEIWVFGNQKGYLDNTRYFFEHVSRKEFTPVKIIWLANDLMELQEIEEKGFKVVLKKSFKGYYYSSRSSFSFICNGFSDVNRLAALKSTVINFWHGTPIKKIYLDSRYDLKKLGDNRFSISLSRLLLRFLNRNIDFYYASNEFEKDLVTKAAAISKNKSIALGAPRFDYIRDSQLNSGLRSLLSLEKKIILYAPTWRENSFWHDRFHLGKDKYNLLVSSLASRNSVLLIKTHPLTSKSELISLGLTPSENIIYADDYRINDINSLYKYVDVLITDLSSALFDYLIFNKPVQVFMPDYKDYIEGGRGVYPQFKQLLIESSCKSWDEIIYSLNNDDWLDSDLIKEIAEQSSSNINVCNRIEFDLIERFKVRL